MVTRESIEGDKEGKMISPRLFLWHASSTLEIKESCDFQSDHEMLEWCEKVNCMVTKEGRCTLSCHLKTPWQHLANSSVSLKGSRMEHAMMWQDHLRKALLDMKFKESITHPGVFQHETRDIFLCVHEDDLLLTGRREDLFWLENYCGYSANWKQC